MKTTFFLYSLGLIILSFCAAGSYAEERQSRIVLNPKPTTPVVFYLGLTPRNTKLLEQSVLDISNPYSPHYGNYWSLQELHDFVSPTENDVNQVLGWLQANSVYSWNIENFGDSLRIQSTVDVVERTFKVKLHWVEVDIFKWVLMSLEEPVIPKHLQKVVQIVGGFYNPLSVQRMRSKLGTCTIPLPNDKNGSNPDPGFVTREVLSRLYNFPLNGTVDPRLVSAGPMEYQGGNGFSQKDLVSCELGNGLGPNQVPPHQIIGTDGYPDDESTLDIQMIGTVAPGANLWYWDANGWMFEWAVDFVNRPVVPQVASLSWGWSETQQCQIGLGDCNGTSSETYVQRTNWEFLKICARGSTVVVASGDAGSPGRTEEGCQSGGNSTTRHMNPVFPGGSPWVLSVGATYLVEDSNAHYNYTTPVCSKVNCANGTVEEGVSHYNVGWTSGSGFDHWTQRPLWQYNAVESYLNSGVSLPKQIYWNRNGRAYPDVSAIGHNCAIVNGGQWDTIDGTSCSAPIWAGIVTLLNQHQRERGRPTVGFVNPLLYQMYQQKPNTFQDITVGNSSCTEFSCCGPQYGFLATKGWDPVAGLGTPNVQEITNYLDNFFNTKVWKYKVTTK